MRNKLGRRRKRTNASCPSKDRPQAAEVVTLVVSESRCSGDEAPRTDSASPEAKHAHGSNVPAAGVSARKPKPLQGQRTTFCAHAVRIAPMFLHSKRKRSGSDGKLGEPGDELQGSLFPPRSEAVQLVKSQTVSRLTERKGSWREQLAPSVLQRCLERIQTPNPTFPVQTVFSTLQKKTSLQEFGSRAGRSPRNRSKEKRGWGKESAERAPKHPRSSLGAEGAAGVGRCLLSAQGVQESSVLTVEKRPRSNKLSRTRRLRPSGSPVSSRELDSGATRRTESHSRPLKTSDVLQRDCSLEDVLWTDKYSPQHSSEVIGNCASVNKLQRWLKKWKLRADFDERRKMEERKREDNSNDSWDCGDFQGEAGPVDDRDEPLCNTMLITGPPGVGKTASVYACSRELGFKVFEVNCSSQRSGRHVLSQLKEATQSHLVDMSGKDPLKPTHFNNYSCAPKSETFPRKTVRPNNVASASKKRTAQIFGHSSRKGKANPATVTLANYFNAKAKADHLHFDGLSPSEKPDSKKSGSPSPGWDQTVPQNKKTATSLILFEEVDVIFDEDVGFFAAIKTFMTTAKRPVILTTNDPSFRERFNGSLEEVIFKTPSAVDVCSYLQLVGLAENVQLGLDDVSSLLRLSRGDIRRCLLQLQLWLQSGGGWACQLGGLPEKPTHQYSSLTERGDNVESQHPQRDTGCTASMLGLHPVTPNQLLNLLKCQYWSEIDTLKLLRLLAESWRGGVPILYSNLELLLPITAKRTSVHFLDRDTGSGLQSEPAPSDIDSHIQRLDGDVSPKASATNSKSVRNISRLSRRKYITTMFDPTSSPSLTQTPPRTSLSSKRAHSRAPSSRDKTEQNAAKGETGCLDALSNFFDLMSYLDATMRSAGPLVSGPCRPEAFVWTGAEIKDGLLDELSEEDEECKSRSQERLVDIQAAVECYGCHRCCWQVSEAWTEAQKYRQELGDTRWGRLLERLTLPASSRRQSLNFQPLWAPSVSQRRYELSRMVLGSESFGLLGNTQAVSVDYTPFLRYVCRFQRAQQQKEEPVGCLNYLSRLRLGLSKSAIRLLAEDFS